MAASDNVFGSKYADVEVPTGISISDFVLGAAAKHGEREALVDGPSGRSYTFAQIAGACRKVAAGLAGKGLAAGETVCLFSPNLPEYALAFHGTILANGVVTTSNPLYTAQELSHQLVSSKAKFVVTIGMFEEKVAEAIKLAGDDADIKEVFVFGEPTSGATPFTALLAGDAADCPKFTRDSKTDTAVLPYSSGTTGLPKGVELTHENLISNILQLRAVESAMGPDDVFLGLLPFFHIYGMVVILNAALYIGAKVVTVPKFEPESFLTTVQKYKLTILHLVPPIVLFLAKHPVVDKFDLTSVKLIFCGAAPLGAELSAAATKRLNGCRVKQGYGMTETSPVTHINPDDDIVDGSAGVLVPNMQARIVDVESGENQPAGEEHTGELWVKGPNVMKGYLNNPEATASTVDADGWLHTGDIAYVDESGNFFIVDRLKELIKYKGFQVPPAELEALLLTHEAIADAAVIGVPDEEAGELPKAFIVLKPDQKLDAEGVNAFLEPQIAPHKKLRGGVEFIDAIPKSASGKILRRELKAKEVAKQQEQPGDGKTEAEPEAEAPAAASAAASAATAAAEPAKEQQQQQPVEEVAWSWSDQSRELLTPGRAAELSEDLDTDGSKATITSVNISGKSFDVHAMAKVAPRLAALEKLAHANLSDCIAGRTKEVALPALESLAAALAPRVPQLRSLNVSENALGANGVPALAALFRGAGATLERLWCDNNGVSSEALDALVDLLLEGVEDGAPIPLRLVHFHNNMIGSEGGAAFERLLSRAAQIEDVRVSGTRIGDEGMVKIFGALDATGTTTLKRINVSNCTIGDEARGAALAVLRRSSRLEVADLSDAVDEDSVRKAIAALRASGAPLRVINLTGTELNRKALKDLTDLLATDAVRSVIEEVQLADNDELESKGASALAAALAATEGGFPKLRVLDLESCCIGSRGARALLAALAKEGVAPAIEKVNLGGNTVAAAAVTSIDAACAAAGKAGCVEWNDNDDEEDEEDEDESEDESDDDDSDDDDSDDE